MTIADLIAPEAVIVGLRAGDRRKLIDELSALSAPPLGLDAREVSDALLRREELGSTGMGEGAAIPHARLPGVAAPRGWFVRLRSPIDWDAIDSRPVDLACLLLLPSTGRGSEPLSALAGVARRLRSAPLLQALRQAPDAESVYALLTAPSPA